MKPTKAQLESRIQVLQSVAKLSSAGHTTIIIEMQKELDLEKRLRGLERADLTTALQTAFRDAFEARRWARRFYKEVGELRERVEKQEGALEAVRIALELECADWELGLYAAQLLRQLRGGGRLS